jgi:hypothetical protein
LDKVSDEERGYFFSMWLDAIDAAAIPDAPKDTVPHLIRALPEILRANDCNVTVDQTELDKNRYAAKWLDRLAPRIKPISDAEWINISRPPCAKCGFRVTLSDGLRCFDCIPKCDADDCHDLASGTNHFCEAHSFI